MSLLRVIGRGPACVPLVRHQIQTKAATPAIAGWSHPHGLTHLAGANYCLRLDIVRGSSHLSDPENKGSTQTGINFDTLGSWNNRLNFPISVEKSIQKGRLIPEVLIDEIGKASLLGRRKVNEDRFLINKLDDRVSIFAILDGHGGSVAVDFIHDHIEQIIVQWMKKTKDLSEVLHNSFILVNNLLARHIAFNCLGSTVNTGSTATICLLRDNIELVIGHVGDSRAVLCRDGVALRLTKDHCPDDHDEKQRIKAAGGFVSNNSLGIAHVNGRLTMTRSIGDLELKSYGVTAEPYIRSIEVRHGQDSFLALTTDGVSFVLSDQEMIDTVSSCVSPSEGAHFITDQALQFGSEDNATCVIIPFGAWGKYRNTTRSIPYSFGRNMFSNRS